MGWVFLFAYVVSSASCTQAQQPWLSLDGEWTLTLDKDDSETKRIAAAGGKTTGPITVPGAWQAQGFGEETEREWHQYMGVATYERSVVVPVNMTVGRRAIWLVAENVHRSVKLLVGAAQIQVAQHEGYLTRLEADITSHVPLGGGQLLLQLVVNSTKNDGHDGLRGTNDVLDFGFQGWGGINGHIRLESRAAAWLADPHVQFELNAPQYTSASLNTTVTVGKTAVAFPQKLSLEVAYLDAQNRTVGSASAITCTPPVCTSDSTTLQSPALWSPASPALHVAVIVLKGEGEVVLDTRRVSFGLREITTSGAHFKLNGIYLYLQGYGDDSVYPHTIAPPVDKSVYVKRLTFVKSLGFHFVRCHSHILPDEYFEAAAEVGVLVSAEFPMIYGAATGTCPAKVGANATGCDASLTDAWIATVKRLRNFPSVFDYTMDNEDINFHMAQHWYDLAKQLDPTRLVNTADGVCCGEGPLNETTDSAGPPGPVDFRSTMCCGPIFRPKPYHFPTPPKQPAISHETGNFNTFPHLKTALARFNTTSGVKPWWLLPTRHKLQVNGLLDDSERWAVRSDQLYISNWKMLTEAMRKSTYVSGYEWWLLQEYYGVGDGILDTHFQPKVTASQLQEIANMNQPIVLLLAQPEDDLPIPDEAPRFNTFGYVTNDTIHTSLHVSNWADAAINEAMLTWEVVGFNSEEHIAICFEQVVVTHVAQGPPTTWVANISCGLPNRGSFYEDPKEPLALTLRATLVGSDHKILSTNSWRSRLYAMYQAGPAPVRSGAFIYTSVAYCNSLPFTNMICHIPSLPTTAAGKVMPAGSVIIVSELDATVMGHATAGATVLLLNSTTSTLPTATTPFVSNWWIGQWSAASAKSSGVDPRAINNAGTVVYSERWPHVFESMAPEGWCDETWFRLVDKAQVFKLDGVSNSSAEVILRATEMPVDWSAWPQPKPAASNNALVWAARVVSSNKSTRDTASALRGSSGGGTLIASGLKLLTHPFPCNNKTGLLCSPEAVPVPEAAWTLFAIVRAAARAPPQSSATVSPESCHDDHATNVCPKSLNCKTCVVNASLPNQCLSCRPGYDLAKVWFGCNGVCVCGDGPCGGCPAAFPFPCGHLPGICYKTKAEAAASTGPCDSWCQKSGTPPAGCGQLCPPAPPPPLPSSCPSAFPFPDQKASGVGICYKTRDEAAAGTGPCDSWCQQGAQPPAGCGQLCPTDYGSFSF